MTCLISFNFTGLLSPTQSWSAVLRNVPVEMSPVRTMRATVAETAARRSATMH